MEAVRQYRQLNSSPKSQITVQEAFKELLEDRTANTASPCHIKGINGHLGRFTQAFQCPLDSVIKRLLFSGVWNSTLGSPSGFGYLRGSMRLHSLENVISAPRAVILLVTLTLCGAVAEDANHSLEIQSNPIPTITVNGSVGSTYRVDYTTRLGAATEWLRLDELTLTQPIQTLTDLLTPYDLQRFYRSVLIPSQAALTPGEAYSFVSVSGGMTNEQTLVVSSAQTGW
ncbi:MAG: hypothetical protein ACKVJX_01720, partial [Verrucomicrobiia bacterium]